MPHGRICCTYHQVKASSPNRSKQKSHTKEPTFRKMEVCGKRSQENGPKVEKEKTERATGLGRRTKRGDLEKWDQTGSLEILDWGEPSENPGLPSGAMLRKSNDIRNRLNKARNVFTSKKAVWKSGQHSTNTEARNLSEQRAVHPSLWIAERCY